MKLQINKGLFSDKRVDIVKTAVNRLAHQNILNDCKVITWLLSAYRVEKMLI